MQVRQAAGLEPFLNVSHPELSLLITRDFLLTLMFLNYYHTLQCIL